MAENGNKQRPVRKLTVKNFSVIKDAELEFGKITVLIGPQSSGKSLLCKLAYFLGREVTNIAIDRVVNRFEYSDFTIATQKEFSNWFPKGGWGNESWSIVFSANEFEITVTSPSLSEPNSDPVVRFSDAFRSAYIRRIEETLEDQQRRGFPPLVEGLRSLAATSFMELAGRSVWDNSTYIPTERSYFVDTKKGYRALEGDADQISSRFAVVFADSLNPDHPTARVSEYLGGKVVTGQDGWSFAFRDGRFLPLSHLSSGSKETLPILAVLDLYEFRRSSGRHLPSAELYGHKLYSFDEFTVEEPEASVFPKTQYDLVKEFAALTNEASFVPYFTITTHSPYILSAFNDLIEAGRLGEQSQLHAEVNDVIPEKYWVKPGDFKAYSIHDGKLDSIMDKETGLINGEYLDAISNKIGGDFDALLRIGYAKS